MRNWKINNRLEAGNSDWYSTSSYAAKAGNRATSVPIQERASNMRIVIGRMTAQQQWALGIGEIGGFTLRMNEKPVVQGFSFFGRYIAVVR